MCRAPEAAENGLRLDALGNLISITVLSVYFNTNVVGTLVAIPSWRVMAS